MYSPAPMEKAPASNPASPATTMKWWLSAAAPATPMISERFDTRPSFVRKVAARNAPLLPPTILVGSISSMGPGCTPTPSRLRAARVLINSLRAMGGCSVRAVAGLVLAKEPLELGRDGVAGRDLVADPELGLPIVHCFFELLDIGAELPVLLQKHADTLLPFPLGLLERGQLDVGVEDGGQPLHEGQRGLRVGRDREVVGDRGPEADRAEARPVGRVVQHADDARRAFVLRGGQAQLG